VPQANEGEPASGIVVLVSNRQTALVNERDLVGVAERTLVGEGRVEGELSLSFVTSEEMADLHATYMGEEGPTDVLSFPMDEDGLLGDVVIAPAEAARNNPDVEAELRLLVAHGVLHLLGYDHEEEAERRVMWGKQALYSRVTPG
jgi:probable rRNA maturation factor